MKRYLGSLAITTLLIAGCDGDDTTDEPEPEAEQDAGGAGAATDEAQASLNEASDDASGEDPADLPPSTVEDWTALINDANPNGLSYALDQAETANTCLPQDADPICGLAGMAVADTSGWIHDALVGAKGEGDGVMIPNDPLGPPPEEIADLIDTTIEVSGNVNEVVDEAVYSPSNDCIENIGGDCAEIRADAADATQEFIDLMAEWEPHLN